MNEKKSFKKSVAKHHKELNNDDEKMNAALERIRNLPSKQKKMAQKALKKLPKSMQEAAKKLFEE